MNKKASIIEGEYDMKEKFEPIELLMIRLDAEDVIITSREGNAGATDGKEDEFIIDANQ